VAAGNTYTYTYTYNGTSSTSVSSSPVETSQPADTSSTTPSTENTTLETSDASNGADAENNIATTIDESDTSAPLTDTVEPQSNPAGTTVVNTADNNSFPVASHDASSTELNTAVNIGILSNDSNLLDLPLSISIISPPRNGRVIVEADNTITYIPDNGYTGTDGMFYEVMDADGDKAIASVAVDVQCSDCPADVLVTLTWSPNSDDVLGYAVYFGPSDEDANQLATILPLTSNLLNPESPSIQYHLGSDLGLVQGNDVCFRLKAYNEFGFSDFSGVACLEAVI